MADAEQRRKCFKCGCSFAQDNVKLFRFPKPSKRNLVRCEHWAQYIFPEREYSSFKLQTKLHNEHRMLCQKHFRDEDFTDPSKKKLLRTAVPSDTIAELLVSMEPQPGPSHRVPLCDMTNAQELSGTITSEPEAVGKIGKEIALRAKCKKYVKKICQFKNRIKTLKSKAMLTAIEEDKYVQKLSTHITPAFALLLHGQIRNVKRKKCGRRWSKEEKIIALRIYKRSPTCYRLLRRLFPLPSPSTLKTLLNKIPFGVGANQQVFEVLKKFVQTQKPSENIYTLMFDEMSLKKHMFYNTKDDVIEGFQDHGTQGRSPTVAGYALVFMIAGVRRRIKQPIAHYFSSGFSTADRLAVLIKEVLHQCIEIGLNIDAIVCDMDGVNRRALAILGASSGHPQIIVNNKEIVTMFDTPHLLKCFRNLFMKYDIECTSNVSSGDRMGIGIAKWDHIKQFHEVDNENPNFVFAPCLKKDHLNPNSKQKMKVNLAAQVLSHSVAAGLFHKSSNGSLTPAAAVTANVVANMDRLFDALNSDSSDLRRGKPDATNMTATSPHLKLFIEMKAFFSSMRYVGSPRKPPSQEGWVWTITAVERLWKNLAQKHQIKSLATRRLQQDPLENLFGCIRGNCGSNTNPTCGQFVAGLKTAILSNLSNLGTTGNCENDNNVVINNFMTLLSNEKVTPPDRCTNESESLTLSELLPIEIDEALNENSEEIQACAYVCGFLIKRFKLNCQICRAALLSESAERWHMFVECREYNEFKKSLNYASRDLVACVEYCACIVNKFLNDKGHLQNLRINILQKLKENVNFDFLQCDIHKEENVNNIALSIFMICVKRFCIIKNRQFSEESSAIALKRKMNIILHK